MKIKFRLEKMECALCFQVTFLDELFLEIDRPGEFESIYGYTVFRGKRTYISDDKKISLAKNNNVWVGYFGSNKERDKICSNIIRSIREWATEWPGFNLNVDHQKDTGEISF